MAGSMLKRSLFTAMALKLKGRTPLERLRAAYGMDVVDLPPNVTVGRHTYGIRETTFNLPTPRARISIGSFCSIGPEVRILGQVDHATALPSTYPFRTLLFRPFERPADPAQPNFDAVTRGPVSIGNDVWIGLRAIILSGVTIGSGAIIGAGAVVARDVPPYAVAVGNPAKVIRSRFPEETVERLLRLAWWDLPDDKLIRLDRWLYEQDIDAFIDAVGKLKDLS